MDLPIPAVGTEPGPQYATDVNNCLTLVDGHDHSPGYGVQIEPAGLNINSDLTFQGNNALHVRSVRFDPQGAPLTAPDLAAVYVVSKDLYYNDADGNQIRITQAGSVVGPPGTITGLPSGTASASYQGISSTFVFQSATNTAANIDVGSVLMRNLTPNSFALTLSPPGSIPSDYTITLPALPASTKIMTLDSAGNMTATLAPDGVTIIQTGNSLVVPSGIHYSREHAWEINGRYANLTIPATEVDSIFFAPYNITIQSVWIYNGLVGTGTTEMDLKVATTSGGSYTSILSTTGKVTSAAASGVWTDSGSVIGAQTGVTKPVLATTAIAAGSAIRFDLLQGMASPAQDARIRIYYIQT